MLEERQIAIHDDQMQELLMIDIKVLDRSTVLIRNSNRQLGFGACSYRFIPCKRAL